PAGPRRPGPPGADGGRRAQRRAGPGRRACLDGAGDRNRREPGRRRHRVPGRLIAGGAPGAGAGPRGRQADAAEPGTGAVLQFGGGAAGGPRLCHAAGRGPRHVVLVDPGDRQCAAPRKGKGTMTILLYLIPVALVLGGLGLAAFLWALKSGQYEDMEGAANRILFDDDEDRPNGTDGPRPA